MTTDTIDADDVTEPMPAGPSLDPDPTAPYGRTEDGTLLDRNGKRAPYGLTRSGLRKDHRPRKRTTRAGSQPSRPSGRTITVKRRQGLMQLADLPKGALLGLGLKAASGEPHPDPEVEAGRQARAQMLLADAVTVDMHAPALCDAVAQLADDNDQLARVVDRIIEVGPMAAIGFAVGSFLAQIARNHGAIPAPVGAMLGAAHDPAELAAVALGSLGEGVQANGSAQQPQGHQAAA